MADPSLALQGAIYPRLQADCPSVSGRVYDRPPQAVVFPYIGLGESQTVDDSADCVDGVEVFLTLHVWSRAVGRVEAKRIASEVRSSLHEAELDLGANWHFHLIEHRSTTVMDDPDGVTSHAVITFRALIDAH
ncbi:DUF3168 domain-containing protein [Labrys sp. (in: a-proteobacteria)]|uniref:DUF3168 domain-containing protein n=1 Tax=Labrys sp. (in: a-proteobacteria) TaxID=1917972 RepID=UPI0039E4D04C